MICRFCVVDTTNDVIDTKKVGADTTGGETDITCGKVDTTDGEADKQMLRLILKYKAKKSIKKDQNTPKEL